MSKKISGKTRRCKQMAPIHLVDSNEKNQITVNEHLNEERQSSKKISKGT